MPLRNATEELRHLASISGVSPAPAHFSPEAKKKKHAEAAVELLAAQVAAREAPPIAAAAATQAATAFLQELIPKVAEEAAMEAAKDAYMREIKKRSGHFISPYFPHRHKDKTDDESDA